MSLEVEGVVLGVLDRVPVVPHAAIEIPEFSDECSSPAVTSGLKALALQVVMLDAADLGGDASQQEIESSNASLFMHCLGDVVVP